jgi:hypothetical protein
MASVEHAGHGELDHCSRTTSAIVTTHYSYKRPPRKKPKAGVIEGDGGCNYGLT